MIVNNLSGQSRVWVYQSTREFNQNETELLTNHINAFVDDWTSHKLDVNGLGQVLYNRFVVFMADEEQVRLGGCSIDSSVRFMKSLEHKFNSSFFDRLNIAYKQGDKILSSPQEEFAELVRKGVIQDDTIVFNNLVQTKAEFESKWQIPYAESWHKNLLLAHTSFNSVL